MKTKTIAISTIFLILALTSLTTVIASEEWTDDNFQNRIRMEVPKTKVDSDITDVPITVEFIGEQNIFWQTLNNGNGSNIRIRGENEGTPYWADYEVVRWDEANHHFTVIFRAEKLKSGTDTLFYLYLNPETPVKYDNPTAVWGASAVYIGHFVNDANDSSEKGNHGAVIGTKISQVENPNFYGGYAYEFNNSSGVIELPNENDFNMAQGTIIINQFYNSSATNAWPNLIQKGSVEYFRPWLIYYVKDDERLGFSWSGSSGGFPEISAPQGENTYKRVTATFDRDTGNASIQTEAKTKTKTLVYNGGINEIKVRIGETWKGFIGNVWLFSEAKSDDWINYLYANSEGKGIFYTDAEEKPQTQALSETINMEKNIPIQGILNVSHKDYRQFKHTNTVNINIPIDEDVKDFPALIKFTSSTHPGMFTGDTPDSIRFTEQGEITKKLFHECIVFTNEEAQCFVRIDLPTTGKTISVWYGDPNNSGEEQKEWVWGANAEYIGHFVNDAKDSSSKENHGTVVGATLVENEEYLGGKGYLFGHSTHRVELPFGMLEGFTELTLISVSYLNESVVAEWPRTFDYYNVSQSHAHGTVRTTTGIPNNVSTWTIYDGGGIPSGKGVSIHKETVSPYQINFYGHKWQKNEQHKLFINEIMAQRTSDIANLELPAHTTRMGMSGFLGTIGNFWIFSEAKSDDWIKAVYQNQENNDQTITLGTETNLERHTEDYTFVITQPPDGGTFSLTNSSIGTFTYTPPQDFEGIKTFKFKVTHPDGETEEAIVTLSITNTPPIAIDSYFSTESWNIPITGTLEAYDPNLDILTYGIRTTPSKGNLLTFDETTGNIIYMAIEGYVGTDSFIFYASDGEFEANATVNLSIGTTITPPLKKFYTTPERTTEAEYFVAGEKYYYTEHGFAEEDNFRGTVHIKLVDINKNPIVLESTRGTIYDGVFSMDTKIPLNTPLGFYEVLIEFEDEDEKVAYRSVYDLIEVKSADDLKIGSFVNPRTYLNTYETVRTTISVQSKSDYQGEMTVLFINDEDIIFSEVKIPITITGNTSAENFTEEFKLGHHQGKPSGVYTMQLKDEKDIIVDSVRVYIDNSKEPLLHLTTRKAIYPISIIALILGLLFGKSVVFRGWKDDEPPKQEEIRLRLEKYS